MRRAYIIGKGRSLDRLRADHIIPGSWVYALNDSIHKVLDVGIGDRACVIMCQMDYELEDRCRPKNENVTVFLSERCRAFDVLKDYKEKFYFETSNPSCLTATMAIEITKKFLNPTEINMLCFDALMNGDLEYASCIGYPSNHFHEDTTRFLRQKEEILQALGGTPNNWKEIS